MMPSKQVGKVANKPLALIAGELIRAANPDLNPDAVMNPVGAPLAAPILNPVTETAVAPFHNPDLRDLLETLRRDTDQLIDHTADELLEATYDAEKAKGLIERYQQFIADHKNELDAIQLIYSKPYKQRHLSYLQIEELAEEIQQPPYNIAPLEVWKAYEQLEKSRVKGVPAKELLTNIVSLIRFSTGLSTMLEPFPELVNQRFHVWLQQQQAKFTQEQLQWLERIRDQIANNAEFEIDDFEMIPACKEEGGLLKASELFGKELGNIVQELNGYLIA